ncbi:MAG: PQQ-dependent sugar dehydrogenase [Cyclobacteriaceae bacterium]
MFRYILYASAVVIAGMSLFLLLGKNGSYARDEDTLSRGKKLFASHCASCHGLEQDGIGPRLGGITNLLSEKALQTFIRDPAKAIGSGNERARALRARYKNTMPSYDWMGDDSIHSILSYVDHQTRQYKIEALAVDQQEALADGLTGRLVPPVKKSELKLELEDYIQIPRLKYSTPELGIVTLRPHPSGDGRLFVSDQGGILYEIKEGKARIFLDMRAHISDFNIGPGIATGLGSFDFHPDFLNNGLLYITHAEKYNGQPADYRISDSLTAEVQWVLGEWKMANVNDKVFKGTKRELLRLHAPTFGHGAQDIGFVPGLSEGHPQYGLLYLGFGDGGSNNIRRPELGHHLKSFLGSILRIDPRGNNSPNGKYGIPADNPFFKNHDPATLRELWAYGFRNPHRLSWDPTNNYRMMVTDIGESNIEEINIVEKGGDYGWPNREGNFGIATKKDLKTVFRLRPGDRDLYKKPFAQYDHLDGHAISGGYLYEGELEALKSKYIFGDIVNGKLFYMNIDPALTDSTVYEITLVQNGKETDLREMSQAKRIHLRIAYDRFSKQLYVITKVDGKIRRVVRAYR